MKKGDPFYETSAAGPGVPYERAGGDSFGVSADRTAVGDKQFEPVKKNQVFEGSGGMKHARNVARELNFLCSPELFHAEWDGPMKWRCRILAPRTISIAILTVLLASTGCSRFHAGVKASSNDVTISRPKTDLLSENDEDEAIFPAPGLGETGYGLTVIARTISILPDDWPLGLTFAFESFNF